MADSLFYRTDGVAAVGHIDASGHFQNTDARSDFTQNWSEIAPVG
jgi:hypothetical protein